MSTQKNLAESRIEKVSQDGRTADLLIFFFADMIETCSILSEKEFAEAGLRVSPKVASLKLMMKYAAKDLRRVVKDLPQDQQDYFGHDADKLFKLILLAIDKTGHESNAIDNFINYIEKFDSKLGLNYRKFGV